MDRPAPGLVGRANETLALQRLLEDVRARGRAMIICGEAGVGKSALLAEAGRVGAAAGMRVLAATGIAAEARVAFAALHTLLSPLLDKADLLPGPQRRALLTAFGVDEVEAPSPLRIGLAALNLMAHAAADHPVLALADDVHWFDDESAQVLLFVARRVNGHPIVVLAGTRDGSTDRFRGADISQMRLEGLAEEDTGRLLSRRAPDLDAGARDVVLRLAAGNPLAVLELPLTMHMADASTGPEWMPLTDRLQEAFAGDLLQLPSATRTLLLAAALHPAGQIGEVLPAAIDVDPDVTLQALSPAVAAGLITAVADTIRFRHPLVRSAVYQAAEHHDRIGMHRALAERSSRVPEHRVWHRVAASVGPDADLAGDLQLLAARYARRGALERALVALEQSANLTVEDDSRGRRLLDAASTALHLGRSEKVAELLRRTDDLPLAPADARRRRVLRWVIQPPAPGDPAGVLDVVASARRSAAEQDRDTALDLLMVAAGQEAVAGREETSGARIVEALMDIGDRPDDARCLHVRALASPLRSGSYVIRSAADARAHVFDPESAAMIGNAALWVQAPEVAVPLLITAEQGLRRRGDARQLSQVLVGRAWGRFMCGDWDGSLRDVEEGAPLSRATDQPLWTASYDILQPLLRALRGDSEDFEPAMSRVEQVAVPVGASAVLNFVQLARALVRIANGDYAVAHEELLRTYDPQDPAHHRVYSCAWLTYLAEAAAHSGRKAEARDVLAAVEPLMQLTDAAQLHIALRHARAVLADDDAELLYKEALCADLAGWPLDRARLQLAWGMWLRRRRRAAESRTPLRRAHEGFEALGAAGWAAQARRELRAAGERSAARHERQHQGLTAQELRIAQLAAMGLTNREIAQRIFSSPRTVASHLYRIFPKLGITSRHQLNQVLPRPDTAD